MKEVKDFKTRYNNLVKETKILTSHKEVQDSQRLKYFIILTDLYIKTYSYLDELKGTDEYQKYLEKFYKLRDVITDYGLKREKHR